MNKCNLLSKCEISLARKIVAQKLYMNKLRIIMNVREGHERIFNFNLPFREEED